MGQEQSASSEEGETRRPRHDVEPKNRKLLLNAEHRVPVNFDSLRRVDPRLEVPLTHNCQFPRLKDELWACTFPPDEQEALLHSNDPIHCLLAGYCLLFGRSGFKKDEFHAFRVLGCSAHPFCKFWVGVCYLEQKGIARDVELGIEKITAAETLHVEAAANYLGAYYQRIGDYARAGLHFYRGSLMNGGEECASRFHELKRVDFLGKNWKPELHLFYPQSVRKEIVVWLIVAKRKGLMKDCSVYCCQFIAWGTRPKMKLKPYLVTTMASDVI